MFSNTIKKYALMLCLFFPIISQANYSKQYYTVDGYSMYADIEGKGKPAVIFEAGLGWDSPTWKDVAPEVAQFTQSVVYDRIGLGKSSLLKQKKAVTARQVVSRLKKLLSAANIDPPYILVGQSIGGLYRVLTTFVRKSSVRL